MFDYTLYGRTEGKWKPLVHWTRPFHTGDVLDETLDEAQFSQRRIEDLELTPFTPIKIVVTENDSVVESGYYVISDTSNEQRTFA